MSTTFKPAYGTGNQSITFSGLNSLGNGSTVFSSDIDNSTNLNDDILVDGLLTANGSGVSATGSVSIIVAASADGSNYPTNVADCVLLCVLILAANSATCKIGARSIAALFGGRLPQHFKLGVVNNTGAALNGSGNSAWYQGVQDQGI